MILKGSAQGGLIAQPNEDLERDIPITDKMQDVRLMSAFLKCEM